MLIENKFSSLSRHKEVWVLAWPIILSNLSVPLLGAVDTAVVGHLPGAHYLGAVAIGAMIFSYLYWGFGFLRMGTTGFVAQANGAANADEVRSVIARAFLLAGILSLFVLALQDAVTWTAFFLIDASEAVETGAAAYFKIRVWATPAVLANYCLLGFFIGLRRTRAALGLQLWMNGINIVLDLVFVLVLEMAIEGVALATVIAEYSALLLGVFLLRGELRRLGGRWIRPAILELASIRKLLIVNLDIFIRTILLIVAFSYFTAQAARMGDVTLAAFAVLINFLHFMAFGLDGFAHAAEGLVGTSIGAKDRGRLRTDVLICTFWAALVALLYMIVYGLFGSVIIDLLTNVEEVRMRAREFLPWLVVAPLIGVWSYLFDGIFIGAMQTKSMRNGMLLSFAIYFTACQVMTGWWGPDGLWFALMIFLLMRAVTLAFAYRGVEKRAVANGYQP